MAAPLPAPTPASSEETDWTDQVADLIVDVVDRVHDRTTGPIIQASRWLVYGTVALFAGLVLAILGIILIGRGLGLLPWDIWISYLAIGAGLCLAGMALWSKRGATT